MQHTIFGFQQGARFFGQTLLSPSIPFGRLQAQGTLLNKNCTRFTISTSLPHSACTRIPGFWVKRPVVKVSGKGQDCGLERRTLLSLSLPWGLEWGRDEECIAPLVTQLKCNGLLTEMGAETGAKHFTGSGPCAGLRPCRSPSLALNRRLSEGAGLPRQAKLPFLFAWAAGGW